MKKICALLAFIMMLSLATPVLVTNAQEDLRLDYLTQDDIDYIEANLADGQKTIAFIPGKTPFSDQKEDGTIYGILPDIVKLIEEKSGIHFQIEMLKDTETAFAYYERTNDGIIVGARVNAAQFADDTKYCRSISLYDSDVVMVTKSGKEYEDFKKTDKIYTLAINTSFTALQNYITNNYSCFNIILVDTVEDSVRAVLNGQADFAAQSRFLISNILLNPRYSSVTAIPSAIMVEQLGFVGETSAENIRLVQIVSKVMASLDKSDVNAIVINHTVNNLYHASFSDIVYQYRLPITLIAILTLACIGLLIAIVANKQKNVKKMEAANNELAEAVLQAKDANLAKSQFLARMSHEIRTPMNAIVGLTEIAKHHENSPDQVDDYLNKIALSSKVLLNIINDVLDMSAIENNKLKIAETEFDIKQVLNGISTIYYPQCNSKGVEFEMATDVEHEFLVGDALRVNQILLNLVSNAYKFTPKDGKITISVKETTHRDGEAYLRFQVADTGCGMTMDMQQRLFKPFEQESSETAQKHGGSGLGLSIAKNLVDMMHGAISVTSQVDVGTTFTVDIPFKIGKKSLANSDALLQSIRILVVDDDPEALEYTAIVLKRMKTKFDSAGSGKEALVLIEKAMADHHPYDVCLIDWKMQEMDGIELTKRIRSLEHSRTLIIIVSAFDLNEVQDAAKIAGADHFVSKPLFQSTLFNVLMSLSRGNLKDETASIDDYDFTGKRVLLAEDNEINAEIATEILEMVHMQVERAEDGKVAVDMFSSHKAGYYDAILMDIQMPVMDGYEATKAIRTMKRPDALQIPILAMTANAFSEDVSHAISVGMNNHISKPIDTQKLYSALLDVISKRG